MIEKPNYRSNGSTTRGNSWPYSESENNSHDVMSYLLFLCSGLLLLVTMPFSLIFCFKTIKEYERAVIFRLGRLRSGARGPGLIFILPYSVTVSVDAVVYFRISNPVISVTNVNDAALSTKLLAQTTLRNILGMKTLSEMLSERDHIAEVMEKILEEGTNPWGVKVERVEVKDIRLPDQLMRVMATEAEATREARAKVIAAEGEQRSSRALHDAAEIISRNPAAVQLRYLQTLSSIGATNNSFLDNNFPSAH
uniref:Band 7 domain-containing protein n=1 Tax=Romanomermis culicivorax TaxID=13658 RepID=A0A915J3R8_ROMCU